MNKYKKSVLIVGVFGVGKTSLLNLLTNSKETTSNNLDTQTTETQSRISHGIKFIDTPGFELSKKEHIMDVMYKIAECFLSESIHGILVCVTPNRLDEVSKELIDCMEVNFPGIYARCILVITKADGIWKDESFSSYWDRQKSQPSFPYLAKFSKVVALITEKRYLCFDDCKEQDTNQVALFHHIHNLPNNPISNNEIEKLKEEKLEGKTFTNDNLNKVFQNDGWWNLLVSNFLTGLATGVATGVATGLVNSVSGLATGVATGPANNVSDKIEKTSYSKTFQLKKYSLKNPKYDSSVFSCRDNVDLDKLTYVPKYDPRVYSLFRKPEADTMATFFDIMNNMNNMNNGNK